MEGILAGMPVIPAASPIEQMAFRQMPIGAFAPRADASKALDRVWREIEMKLGELQLPSVA